jgi:hypothetical protein
VPLVLAEDDAVLDAPPVMALVVGSIDAPSVPTDAVTLEPEAVED